jgi:uncharacterized membrane protein
LASLEVDDDSKYCYESHALMSKSTKTIGFLKTTAIGGVLFLLPLIVIGALVGQVVPIILTIAEALGDIIPLKTPAGIALLVLLALATVLLLCFAAGLLARRSFGRRISEGFEKGLLMLFPRYAILRDQMAGTIGGDETKPQMKPVLASLNNSSRLGFEIERSDDGLVTVYLPGSPDPWSGSVVFLKADRIQRPDIEFGDAVAIFEQLGRGSASLLADKISESL